MDIGAEKTTRLMQEISRLSEENSLFKKDLFKLRDALTKERAENEELKARLAEQDNILHRLGCLAGKTLEATATPKNIVRPKKERPRKRQHDN